MISLALPLRDLIGLLTVVGIWGVGPPLLKTAALAFPPFLMLALRFLLVALILVPLVPRPPRGAWGPLLGLTVCLGLGHFGLLFLAFGHVQASTMALVTLLGVPFSVALGRVILGEFVGVRRWLGLVVALAGAALLAGQPTVRPALGPFLAGVTSMVGWALGTLMLRRLGHLPPLTIAAWMSLLGVPLALLVSLVTESGQGTALRTAPSQAWAALAWLAVMASMVAYGLWYWLLGRHPVSVLAPAVLLVPVIGVVASVLTLGEPFGWTLVAGGGLTLLGVAVIQQSPVTDGKGAS